MKTRLCLEILPQPDDTTCGPTCLHAVYRYYDDPMGLQDVIDQTDRLEEGGTLAVLLATHALQRGYSALIYTYNLNVFDPTWFPPEAVDLPKKLRLQARHKKDPKLRRATRAYLEFLELGGELFFEDLKPSLIRKYLEENIPILTGLSATYLFRRVREFGPRSDPDDLRGNPVGHFVVLCGYDRSNRTVRVADPLHPNPFSPSHYYEIEIDRVIGAILLGIVTYDANLLVIQPRRAERPKESHAHSDRR